MSMGWGKGPGFLPIPPPVDPQRYGQHVRGLSPRSTEYAQALADMARHNADALARYGMEQLGNEARPCEYCGGPFVPQARSCPGCGAPMARRR